MSVIDQPSLFDRARQVAPAEVARQHGGKLHRAGKNKARGGCPLCDGRDTFLADDPGPIWHCFSCGATGDSVALEMELGGHPDRTAAARVLAGEAPRIERERAQRTRSEEPQSELVDSAVVASWIAEHMRPARGTIVEAWLTARGIDPARIGGALDRLFFLRGCPVTPWRVGRSPDGMRSRPAMVAPLRATPDGAILGVHTTYLRSDGSAKADLGLDGDGRPRKARKMWGRARMTACFLADPADAGPLVPGEGIETVLSYAAGLGACRPLALLSLDNLQGRAMRDAEGAVPLWNIRSDPDAPPFTLPNAGEVRILVDADMKPHRIRAQAQRRGRREMVMIDGGVRAEICATLATQAWRRAGGAPVRALRPPMGMDFNDLGRAA
ncbi:DUF7146 domain-containing protein [Sphingomonas nostoxanthinifaciens]|uniref:DUF7146 domain-containing protein n=1 Tax=Sphingomonas nostoxanthinifaciens TaxID=2872652 RepID=UPI001CC1CC1A|nr:hypothetical protein [Sphingomonas nostoxanthinifaciens]UAK24201.1 hypothetical protein K8P63_18020 [Sphingomonas nostoxanthinifaciens]